MTQKNNFAGFEGTLEEVHCPTCGPGAESNLIFRRNDGIGFHQCRRCDMEFASPRFTEQSLLNIYESDNWKSISNYDDWSYEEWKNNHGQHYHLVQQNLKLVKKFLPVGSSILDVGCDIGLTVKGLCEMGYPSEGIEPGSIGAKIAKEKTGITVHQMEIGAFQSDTAFDSVMLLDVLEHLYNPVKTLQDCGKHMKSGGYLFIHVPHHDGLSNRYKRFLHRIGLKDQYKHFGFPAHIYSFNKSSLQHILKKSGFETIHFESWPSQITRGKINLFNYIPVQLIKKFALSDYIICISRKI